MIVWFLIGHIFTTLISLIRISRLSENNKDLELIILRHQLDVMVRKQSQPVSPNRAEKVVLAQLAASLRKYHRNNPYGSWEMSFVSFVQKQSSDGIENWYAANGTISSKTKAVVP